MCFIELTSNQAKMGQMWLHCSHCFVNQHCRHSWAGLLQHRNMSCEKCAAVVISAGLHACWAQLEFCVWCLLMAHPPYCYHTSTHPRASWPCFYMSFTEVQWRKKHWVWPLQPVFIVYFITQYLIKYRPNNSAQCLPNIPNLKISILLEIWKQGLF